MNGIHTIAELLDLAKERSDIASDRKLAGEMEVVPQQISQWRHGTHVPKGDHVATLAQLTGLTEEYVLICMVSAEGKRSEEERRVLRQIAGKLRRSAAVIAMGIAGILGVSHTPPARADAQSLYIMENYVGGSPAEF